jgi:hypothetical protein
MQAERLPGFGWKNFLDRKGLIRSFLSVIAVLAVKPAWGTVTTQPGVVSFCQHIMDNLTPGNEQNPYLALARKLILEKDAVEESAFEALLASPEAVSLLEFGYRHLSIQEATAFKRAFAHILSPLRRNKTEWENLKTALRGLREVKKDDQIRRVQAREATEWVFVPVKLQVSAKGNEFAGIDAAGEPLFFGFNDYPQEDLLRVLVNSRKTKEYPIRHTNEWQVQQMTDGTILQHYVRHDQGKPQVFGIRDVLQEKELFQIEFYKMGLTIQGVTSTPQAAYYRDNLGKLHGAFWVTNDNARETQVVIVDVGAQTYTKRKINHTDEPGFWGKDGILYFIMDDRKWDPSKAAPTYVMPVYPENQRGRRLVLRDSGKLQSRIHVKKTASGKAFLLSLNTNQMTAVNLTDGTQKFFEGVHSEGSNGIGKISESAKGDVYFTTYTQPATTKVGATIYNLTSMTSHELRLPGDEPFPQSFGGLFIELAHLKDGRSFAVAALGTLGHINRIVINSLNKDGQVMEFPVKEMKLRSLSHVRVHDDGRIDGYFNHDQGLTVIQLHGPLK